jgi:hypothetical protein
MLSDSPVGNPRQYRSRFVEHPLIAPTVSHQRLRSVDLSRTESSNTYRLPHPVGTCAGA